MIDSDISIAGGTVYWNISADVCNESNSKIKVTDRNAYCTYTTISIADPPSFVLGSMPFEYMENKGYEYSTLESENKWQDYLSELVSDLKGQYIITLR